MNSPQFTRWRAFDVLYPTLEERVDIAAGMIIAAIYNAAGGKRDGGSFTAAECMPDYLAAHQPKPSPEEEDAATAARIHAIFAAGLMDPVGDNY